MTQLQITVACAATASLACTAGFAAWVRRLSRRIPEGTPLAPEQRADFLHRARSAKFVFGVLQFVVLICIGIAGARERVNLLFPAVLLFLATVLVGGQLLFGLERKVRGYEVTRAQALRGSARALVASLAFYGLFFLVIQQVARLLPGEWHFLKNVAGVGAALLLFALASPVFVRALIPSSRVTDGETIALLEACFRRAGLAIPDFWTFDLDRAKVHNAAVAGLSLGRGPFRPTLFFTRSLVKELTRGEFEAVMLHEVSHLSLGHLRKRILAGLLAFVFATLGLSVLLALSSAFITRGTLAGLIPGSVVVSFGFQLWMVRRVVRRQELEADENAVRLGASPDALVSALVKITELNDVSARKRDLSTLLNPAAAHPVLEERVAELRRRVAMGLRPLPSPWLWLRWAVPVTAALALVLGAGWRVYLKPARDLVSASLAGDAASVTQLLKSGAGADSVDRTRGFTALQAAAFAGRVDVAIALIESGADVNLRNAHGSTALTIASEFGREEFVALLLSRGANPDAMDNDGDTSLGMALSKGHGKVVEHLRKSGAHLPGRYTPEPNRAVSGE